jgi:hypothetical protein
MYALKEETLMEGISNGSTKVRSILFSYFILMRLGVNRSISFEQQQQKKILKKEIQCNVW